MNTLPSFMTYMIENRLRTIISWLITMADKKYERSAPQLHKAGQEIMSQLFSIECSEIKTLGFYSKTSSKVLVDNKIMLIITCVGEMDCYVPWYFQNDEETTNYKYKQEKYLLTTLPSLPDVINEFENYGFKVICRDAILNLLARYENSHDAIRDYVHLLQASPEKDFRLIPFGKWSEGDYLSMLQLLQKEVDDLKFPIDHNDSWVCEISKPMADAGIIISLIFGYNYSDIGIFAEAVNGEEIPKLHLKKLQDNLRVEMKFPQIPDSAISFPVIKPKNRFKLASINQEWLYDILHMVKSAAFINTDTAIERIKICDHLVNVLARVKLPSVRKPNESIEYPSLEL